MTRILPTIVSFFVLSLGAFSALPPEQCLQSYASFFEAEHRASWAPAFYVRNHLEFAQMESYQIGLTSTVQKLDEKVVLWRTCAQLNTTPLKQKVERGFDAANNRYCTSTGFDREMRYDHLGRGLDEFKEIQSKSLKFRIGHYAAEDSYDGISASHSHTCLELASAPTKNAKRYCGTSIGDLSVAIASASNQLVASLSDKPVKYVVDVEAATSNVDPSALEFKACFEIVN